MRNFNDISRSAIKFFNAQAELREICIKYLDEAVNKAIGKRISLEKYEDGVSVVYDGGRHTEYNSNAFSYVEAIYVKEYGLYLQTEDTEQYNIENLSSTELFEICKAIDYINKN